MLIIMSVAFLQHRSYLSWSDMPYNFCDKDPSQSFIADFQRINELNVEQYDQLLEEVFGFLSSRETAEQFTQNLHEYAERIGINGDSFKDSTKSLIVVIHSMIKRKMSMQQIEADFQALKVEESLIKRFREKWGANFTGLQSSLLKSKFQGKRLVGLDWKLGVTAASSELKQVGSCFIQMKLMTGDRRQQKTSVIEMSVASFYDLMHETEKARMSLESATLH